MPVKGRNHQQSQRTRDALINAARELFAAKGFADTGTEEIVARAGVSRGALYHQFEDKRALFLAVFESVERELMARLTENVAGRTDPVEMLRLSGEAFLDLCLDPEVRQIALIDAPSVVGWQTWREVDARYGLGLLRMLLGLVAEQGQIDSRRVEHLAHLFLGAVSEAAMVVAHAPDDAEVRASMGESLTWMIDRLLKPGSERNP
jgi:AcrR family transcriptional regulator